jgi:transcriptional regulator with XRE-family HTH domain
MHLTFSVVIPLRIIYYLHMDQQAFYELGQYLRQRRFDKGLSQVEVAKKLGYSSQFIANWERGVSSPPMQALKKIVDIYGINQREFLEKIETIQKSYWKRSLFSKKSSAAV